MRAPLQPLLPPPTIPHDGELEHSGQAAFLAVLDKAALAAGLATGEALNLDFHAVMHWGEDPVLEKHYVPRHSQATRSVLTFFAEDAATYTLLYANADVSKASQNREVIAFADHWKAVTGHDPALLIFDSKLTTQAVLAELDDRHPRRPPAPLPQHRRHHRNRGPQIVVRLNRRTYSPVLRQATLPQTITLPWWEDRILHYAYD